MKFRHVVAAVVLAPLLAGLVAAFAVYHHFRLDLPAPLSDAARAQVVDTLRGALEGRATAPAADPGLARRLPGRGPAIVTLWVDGRRSVRVEGRGDTAADAVAVAGSALAAAADRAGLDAETRRRGRLQVDLVVARGPFVASVPLMSTFGLLPGMDGLGVEVAGQEALLGADETVQERLLLSKRPLPFAEFDMGLEFERADALLAKRAALPPGGYSEHPRHYFRFRAETFVERPADRRGEGPPLLLTRGLPPGPPPTAPVLREAAAAGGRYLVRHVDSKGHFDYLVDADGESATGMPKDYSLPRHAGSTYFLAQLYGAQKDPEVRRGLDLAVAYLADLAQAGGCRGSTREGKPFACVLDRGGRIANIGSSALTAVALAEYRLATGDTRYDELHRAILEFILAMQLPSGRFCHYYEARRNLRDEKTQLLYFDGESALALARGHVAFGDPRYVAATERALDHLVGMYDFFAGQFFFGEEHWTCIAAEAAWPALKKDRYRRFCSAYAAFLRDQQFQPGENPTQPDLAGSYGVTPFVVPHNTPVGSRSEAMISAYLLTVHHGKPDERIRRQVVLAMGHLLRQQLTEDNTFFSPVPDLAGAITTSAIEHMVRIDYIQHGCSAMLRTADLLVPAPN